MCGIAGMIGPRANRDLVETMVDCLSHRGPDARGVHHEEGLSLGHRRLSVIDLSTGDQPMTNEDSSLWVVYNGEIYNFQELRGQLESAGHRFHSKSDTEVLVHGYEQWGLELLPRLDGIFAFALWDQKQRQLLLVRDYFGIKPLHYQISGGTLRFASEAKAILCDDSVPRQVDFQALHWFMNLRYIPGEKTLFAGISRLLPGHYLTWRDGQIGGGKYYGLPRQAAGGKAQPQAYYEEGIRHHLQNAVRKQMISDVPMGVYLSGGLDSSAIVAMMAQLGQKVRTFSLGFNEPTDELDDARVIAEHFATEHHEMRLDLQPLKSYPEVIWHSEEPKENVLQGYLLAQFARQHVTVAHGGLGGDELFAGYALHKWVYPFRPWHRLVPGALSRGLLTPLSRLAFSLQNATGTLALDEYRRGLQMLLATGDPARSYLILRNTWDFDRGGFANLYGPVLRQQALAPTISAFRGLFSGENALPSKDALEQVLWAEFHTKMIDDFLLNEDRTSMAHGLEVRVPFLDRELVQFANTIPLHMKIRGNQTKRIFRNAMAPLLPEHALRKKKWGFSFNPYYQFQKDLKHVAQRVLTRQRVEARGWFNYSYLRRIMDHPPHPRLRWHYFVLWLAMGLEIWCQMFLEGDPRAKPKELEAYYG